MNDWILSLGDRRYYFSISCCASHICIFGGCLLILDVTGNRRPKKKTGQISLLKCLEGNIGYSLSCCRPSNYGSKMGDKQSMLLKASPSPWCAFVTIGWRYITFATLTCHSIFCCELTSATAGIRQTGRATCIYRWWFILLLFRTDCSPIATEHQRNRGSIQYVVVRLQL